MASKIAEAFAEIRTDTTKFDRGMREVRNSAVRTQAVLGGLKTAALSILGFAGVSFGVSSIVNYLKAASRASAEAERSTIKFNTALSESGVVSKEQADAINESVTALKEQFDISKGTIRSTMTLGLNMGVTSDQIVAATRAAIGLSEVTGSDLESSMMLVTKAIYGNWTAIGKMIPAIKALKSDEEKLAFLEKISARGQEQRIKSQESLAGASERLSFAYEGLKKSTGDYLNQSAPIINYTKFLTLYLRALTSGTVENKLAWTELTSVYATAQKTFYEMIGNAQAAAAVQVRVNSINVALLNLGIQALIGGQLAANKQAAALKNLKAAADSAGGSLLKFFEANAAGNRGMIADLALAEKREEKLKEKQKQRSDEAKKSEHDNAKSKADAADRIKAHDAQALKDRMEGKKMRDASQRASAITDTAGGFLEGLLASGLTRDTIKVLLRNVMQEANNSSALQRMMAEQAVADLKDPSRVTARRKVDEAIGRINSRIPGLNLPTPSQLIKPAMEQAIQDGIAALRNIDKKLPQKATYN